MNEGARIRRRVRSWRPAYRSLADVDDLVYLLDALDAIEAPRYLARPVEPLGQSLVEYVGNERALSRTRHARHARESSQRYLNVDVGEIVLPRADYRQSRPVGGTTRPRDVDPFLAGQVLARQGLAPSLELSGLAAGDDVASLPSGPRAQIDHPVSRPYRLLVVLDHDDRVPDVPQSGERSKKLRVVVLMKTDRRLVQNVQNADESRADLSCQPDALCLAPGQRPRRPVERQIVQPYVCKEPQTLTYLLEDLLGDLPGGPLELKIPEEAQALLDRHRRHAVDRRVVDRHRQRLRAQARPAARGAQVDRHEALYPTPDVLGLRLPVASLQVRDCPLEPSRVLPSSLLERDLVLYLLVARTVQQHLPHAFVEVLERGHEIKAVVVRESVELVPRPTGR